jgi:hypothetical protein
MKTDIILIGPMDTGKSTQGKLLAEKLGLPQCSMDELRWPYYKEIGFDEAEQEQIRAREGICGVYRYWKPFEAHAVERLLSEHQNCIIDFGAGHSVFEDDALFARVAAAVQPYENVVLLLPSPDLDESVALLKQRGWDGMADSFDFHEHFVKHHSNHSLAKKVVYTKGKSPEETRDEILALTEL